MSERQNVPFWLAGGGTNLPPLVGYALFRLLGTGSVEPFLDFLLERMGCAFSGHELKVARFLLNMALEVGLQRNYRRQVAEVTFRFPLPQRVLASELGLEVERVQRALERLQEAGLLEVVAQKPGRSLKGNSAIFRVRLGHSPQDSCPPSAS